VARKTSLSVCMNADMQVNITIGASQKTDKKKRRGDKVPGEGSKKEYYQKQRGSVLKDGDTVPGVGGGKSWSR